MHTYNIYSLNHTEPLKPMTIRIGSNGKTYRLAAADTPNV